MKKTILSTILLAVCTVSFAQRAQVEFKISNLKSDTLFLMRAPVANMAAASGQLSDTLIGKKGTFKFDREVDGKQLTVVIPADARTQRTKTHYYTSNAKSFTVVIDPNEKMTIKGKMLPHAIEYSVKGSPFNQSLAEAMAELTVYNQKSDSIEALTAGMSRESEARKLLVEEMMQQSQARYNAQERFVVNHLNNPASAYLLMRMQPDFVLEYYPKLGKEVTNSIGAGLAEYAFNSAKERKARQDAEKKVNKGVPSPDFTLLNEKGEPFTLSSLRGKYVVLDFWGSWCGWCIKGFPKMKEYYQKYSDKVEFVGVACRDTEAQWKGALEREKLPWIQVINPKDAPKEKDLAILYGVAGFPTKIIISPEGNIIERILGEREEFYTSLDELLK